MVQNDPMIEAIMRRIVEIERKMVTYRQGVVTDDDTLAVALGGSDVPYTDVRTLRTAEPLEVDDPVAVLTMGNTLLALGAIGQSTESVVGTGVMAMCPGSAPTGWLICDGSSFDGGVYPDLADYLGGTTLPDMRNVFPLGSGSRSAGDTGGEAEVELLETNLPEHNHSHQITNAGPFQAGTNRGVGYGSGTSTNNDPTWPGDDDSISGDGTPHNNMPPYRVVNFIIKT